MTKKTSKPDTSWLYLSIFVLTHLLVAASSPYAYATGSPNDRAGAAQAVLFHSPGDDGVSASIPLLPTDGSTVQLFLWLESGSIPSLPNEVCSGAGAGQEVCGWDAQISATGGVTLTGFVTTGDVVHNLSFGTMFRANGGNFDSPPAAPERIGLLSVEATGPGTVEVDGNIFVTSQLDRGNILAGLLATTNASNADEDGDGIANANDNCTLVPNSDQRDTNGDGYGNVCDADLDNNGIVNAIDLGLFKSVFFSAGDLDADFNGDMVVNAIDLGILRLGFFQPPGPSGVAP